MASKLVIKGKQLTGAVANALKINCKDKDGNKSTVQVELNKLFTLIGNLSNNFTNQLNNFNNNLNNQINSLQQSLNKCAKDLNEANNASSATFTLESGGVYLVAGSHSSGTPYIGFVFMYQSVPVIKVLSAGSYMTVAASGTTLTITCQYGNAYTVTKLK